MPSPDSALDSAIAWLRKQPDVRYAEVRFVETEGDRLRVRDGRPEQVTAEQAGVRFQRVEKFQGAKPPQP